MRTQAVVFQIAGLAIVFAVGSTVAQPKKAPENKAPPDEVAQLPRYCWQQYVDGSLGGYEFSIPNKSCGYSMNHYCGALVAMIRAQKLSLPKSERVGYIQKAVKEINYTIHGMKPGCFITKDVLQAKERALLLSGIIK